MAMERRSQALTAVFLSQRPYCTSEAVRFAATGMRPAGQKRKDLEFTNQMIEAGKLMPVIDRSYPLENIIEAHEYVEAGRKRGNVVITVD